MRPMANINNEMRPDWMQSDETLDNSSSRHHKNKTKIESLSRFSPVVLKPCAVAH